MGTNQKVWNSANDDVQEDIDLAAAQAAQSAQAAAGVDSSGTPAGHMLGQQNVNMNYDQQNVKTAKDLPNFVNVLSKLETQMSLTEKGREYHETLRKALEDKSWGTFAIKTIRLTDPSESYLFYDASKRIGVIVVYLETQYNTDHDDSLVRLYGKARTTVSGMFNADKQISVMNVIGIYPEDYDKIGAMIADVKNTFISESDSEFQDLTVSDIKDMNFSINPNLEKVKSFIRNISPHGIMPAMDFGFTIDIMMPKQQNQYFVTGFNQKAQYETKTIAAIVAKTNFLCNAPGGMPGGFNPMGGMGYGANMQYFLPVITITDIISAIKSPELLPLFLTLAQQTFIATGLWKEPFKNFGVKGAINIGNLLENQQTHQLLEMSSSPDVEAFIATYCRPPIMALAVTEGRSRILGMEWLSDKQLCQGAIDAFNNFLDAGSQITIDPVVMRYAEYTGTCSINGEMVDSRYVDYLHIVADNPNEAPNLKPLLMLTSNPMDRAKMIRNISSDYKTKYITMNCALKAEVLNTMAGFISSNIRVQMDSANNAQNWIGLDALIAESQKYMNNMTGFGSVNPMGGYNYTGFFGYRP